MRTRKTSPIVVVLVLVMVLVGLFIVLAANSPKSDVHVNQIGNPPSSVTATSNPTEAVPTATTSVTVPPTTIPQTETAYPTTIVGILPSVVVTGTYFWLPPTPDATEQAEGLHREYLSNLLYQGPSTVVAQGSNTTPVASDVYTYLTLTT